MAPAARSPQSPLIYPRRKKELQKLLGVLGIGDLPNPDWLLLDEALVHCSASPSKNYERLEFMGDAVLRMAASDYLLTHHRDWSVGDMTSVRNIIVSDRYLGEIAQHYQLEQYLVVGKGIQGDRPTRHLTPSRLADMVESLIGALYTMGGSLDWIHPWLEPFWVDKMPAIYNDPTRQNHKAALQEWTQHHFKQLPKYTVKERTGPAERFEAQVWFGGQRLGTGTGHTRKAAEQAAAQRAIATLPAPKTLTPSSEQGGG